MHNNLIIIVGETASGKSALALRLAKEFEGEIICADSWTVRREVNIGTAKPSIDEQRQIPHHLIDVAGPDEDFTAAVFKDLANQAIQDIANRGKIPIIVGGTGLYIDGVIYDYGFLPAGDRQARERWNKLPVDELLIEVERFGLTTDGVDVRNKRRLMRLLETGGQRPSRSELRSETLIIGLQPDRQELKRRIEARTKAMIQAGLEAEVRGLVEKYGWDCEALKGVGYSQWRDYFDSQATLQETEQKINKATLDLAKRQRTWFKRNKSIQWFSTPVNYTQIVELATTFLAK